MVMQTRRVVWRNCMLKGWGHNRIGLQLSGFFESAANDTEELPSRVWLAWLLWHGRGNEQDRPRAESLCAQVRGTQRYAERLTNDYIAAGEVWAQVLKWFQEIMVAPKATQAIETPVDHPRLGL